MSWKIDRHTALLLGSIALFTFCGATLGERVGLHGFDQWPLAGFGLSLVTLATTMSVGRLREKVRALEDQVEVLKKA